MSTDEDRAEYRRLLWRLAQRLKSQATHETTMGISTGREREAAAVRWAFEETGPKTAALYDVTGANQA